MQATDPGWPSAAVAAAADAQRPCGAAASLGSLALFWVARWRARLGVFVGDKLQLTLPKVTVTPAGIFPRIKSFVVTGIFQVGAQVDSPR